MSYSALTGCSGASRAHSIKVRAAEWCTSQPNYRVVFCLVQLVLILFCIAVASVEVMNSSADDVTCPECSEGSSFWPLPPCNQIPAYGRVITAIAVFLLGAFGSSESLQQTVRYALL
eukprot:gnl/MRDRNA2_/MRDRNA2_97999_c0_seq1.p1 gnl/MRDRNA2_/MRDRNA2_97999_c0~~gnl/MRDRNA2_/MRDRNA2_97999_c0_seq1.p1  ORF type:complete len:117 (-),score=14.04 gnl/MRDRNA2_/MRDRNA2_97999_c0_seq1:467-817(-)